MGRLIYSAIASLDGFVEDAHGGFEWAAPGEEAHAFVNELERPVGTYLCGRRMYETMVFWERPPDADQQSAAVREFARIWQGAEKIVYSKTLTAVASAKTRIEREFELAAVEQLKMTSDRDLTVGGAELASHAIRAGVVDEYRLFFVPVLLGAGKRALPEDAAGRTWNCSKSAASGTASCSSATGARPVEVPGGQPRAEVAADAPGTVRNASLGD